MPKLAINHQGFLSKDISPNIPPELDEPPIPPNGVLVPGSVWNDADWAMAAHRLAAGWPVLQVARAMGCHRSTVWRAYYTAPAFRQRIAWERLCLKREAQARLAGLRHLVALQIEKAVANGDMTTTRWLADRIGVTPDDPKHVVDEFREEQTPPVETLALAENLEERFYPDSVPFDWQDEFSPDIPVPNDGRPFVNQCDRPRKSAT